MTQSDELELIPTTELTNFLPLTLILEIHWELKLKLLRTCVQV